MLVKLSDNITTLGTVDYVDEYVADRTIEAIVGCGCQNVYEDYLEFLNENGYKEKISKMQFAKKLTFKYDLTSKVIKYNGKSVRIMIQK